jgi:pimeloyl-ACP methyl ester carboxylesterase
VDAGDRAPVIVVPGIKASGLEDYYPPEREILWSAVTTQQYERVAMHPDDLRFETMEPAQVRTSSPFALVYKDLIEALRYELTPDSRKPVPVFGLGYDWRQDCFRSAEHLEAMIDEALARTRLMPHYKGNAPDRVDIVAHSMGGLVVGLLLAQKGRAARIRRVVTIASPFRGAVDSIALLAMGAGNLSGEQAREREREAARTMPSVYQLLPSYPEAVESEIPELRDLYDVESWQRSIIQTLELYRKRVNADTSGEDLLRAHLKQAKKVRDALRKLDLSQALEGGARSWLAIAGACEPTTVRVGIKRDGRFPRFDFPPPEQKWPEVDTGDGTVPLHGAAPPFLPCEQVVCVTRDDFSFWELKDRIILRFGGFHAALPAMNLVQRLCTRFLRNDYRGPVWGRPYPGVEKTDWPEWIAKKGPLE